MKQLLMLGICLAIVSQLTVGCKSDDDPVTGTGGAGGVAGNASSQATGGEGLGGNTSDPATGGGGEGGATASNTTPDAASSAVDKVPAIAGTYVDDYGEVIQIAEGIWRIDTSLFHITILNNAQEFLIASNDPNNPWSADLWSRFDWTRDSTGALYYCQTAYGAASQQLAEDTARPSMQNFPKGCGVGSWSKLTPDADAGN